MRVLPTVSPNTVALLSHINNRGSTTSTSPRCCLVREGKMSYEEALARENGLASQIATSRHLVDCRRGARICGGRENRGSS